MIIVLIPGKIKDYNFRLKPLKSQSKYTPFYPLPILLSSMHSTHWH